MFVALAVFLVSVGSWEAAVTCEQDVGQDTQGPDVRSQADRLVGKDLRGWWWWWWWGWCGW